MSCVAPVTAVFVMRWTASAATSAGRDKVDADGCECELERFGERRDVCARGQPATAGSADEQERSARAHLADGAGSDVERLPEDLVDVRRASANSMSTSHA
jgi:hypothetical protein